MMETLLPYSIWGDYLIFYILKSYGLSSKAGILSIPYVIIFKEIHVM